MLIAIVAADATIRMKPNPARYENLVNVPSMIARPTKKPTAAKRCRRLIRIDRSVWRPFGQAWDPPHTSCARSPRGSSALDHPAACGHPPRQIAPRLQYTGTSTARTGLIHRSCGVSLGKMSLRRAILAGMTEAAPNRFRTSSTASAAASRRSAPNASCRASAVSTRSLTAIPRRRTGLPPTPALERRPPAVSQMSPVWATGTGRRDDRLIVEKSPNLTFRVMV